VALYKQQPKLGPIGIRPILLRVHADLFQIHRYADVWSAYYPDELTNLEKLVLALEDRRFMKHAGVDLISIIREISRALRFKRHGGASTIDMQIVRTATGYRTRTLGRKLYEVFLALLIQYRYSKIVILRSYLKSAFFGSHLVGAEKAAYTLFNTSSASLTIEQAAFLAAMLVYPKPLAGGETWSSKVLRRSNYGMKIYIANKKRFDQVPA
jgi:membrane peptidoglycan carboxypeptidase